MPKIENDDGLNTKKSYNRREAMGALAKYSAAVGGATTVILSADSLVSEASAYKCPIKSKNPRCR